MPAHPPPSPLTRAQLREQFLGDLLTIVGDTRLLWLPKPTDTTTSADESLNARTITHGATLAGRLTPQGLGYMASFNGSSDYATIPDAANLSFGTGAADLPCSIVALDNITNTALSRAILSKYNAAPEHRLYVNSADDTLVWLLHDASAAATPFRQSNAAISMGAPHLYVATYAGTGGATAANGIAFYEDGLLIASTANNAGTYVAMEDGASPVEIGSSVDHTTFYMSGSIGLRILCAKQLSAHEAWALWKLCKGYFAL